jgi:glycosyl transferase family 11
LAQIGSHDLRPVVTYNTLGRHGRLANQMYQIAGVIGVARRNAFDFAFPQWRNWDHIERYGSTEDCDVWKYFENQLPLYNGPSLPDRWVDWGYHDVKLSHSVSLSGHFQSVRYFEHAMDEVKWYFRMKDEPPQNGYVAVHVRRGDYDDKYHPHVPEGYYREAMGLFEGEKFLVFSDDISACREIFGSEVEYSEGDYLEDFRLMKRCRHFIIANSSYSAMAAVLGDAQDKRVVAPRPWFGAAYTGITGEDIYESGWQVINW